MNRVREAVEIIRLVIEKGHTGELASFEGRYHKHDWSELLTTLAAALRPQIPIWLGVTQPKSIRLAAEIANGVIGHPISTTEWILNKVTPTLESPWPRRAKLVGTSTSTSGSGRRSTTTGRRPSTTEGDDHLLRQHEAVRAVLRQPGFEKEARAGHTFRNAEALRRYGLGWFAVGDLDLATSLRRSRPQPFCRR